MGKKDEQAMDSLLQAQQNEITEYEVYNRIQDQITDAHNKNVVKRIADEELSHYKFFKEHTGKELEPSRFQILKFVILSKIFGITFSIKLMERGEQDAQDFYQDLMDTVPEIEEIISDEYSHEKQLVDLLDEERLRYTGSIVLGLNDALVELTGALSGLTLALQKPNLVAVTGLVTGVAAALSMGASEYLSTKSEPNDTKDPFRASLYTGTAYILTVFLLVTPYLAFSNVYYALGVTLGCAILVILVFSFYISVAQDTSFKRRFGEMAGLSMGVAALSFIIGFIIRTFLGVDV